jgi:hypothetical protein
MKIKHYGYAGHFICSDSCRFHLTTSVGKYLVSTVGALFYPKDSKMQEVGCGRKFETFVFETNGICNVADCGCGLPNIIPREIDGIGCNTAGEAQKNHEKMITKYSKRASTKTGIKS